MDRSHFYTLMEGDGKLDYEVYLNTSQILKAQKLIADLCNKDELMFQVVHQIEELWMKLIGECFCTLGRAAQRSGKRKLLRKKVCSVERSELLDGKRN